MTRHDVWAILPSATANVLATGRATPGASWGQLKPKATVSRFLCLQAHHFSSMEAPVGPSSVACYSSSLGKSPSLSSSGCLTASYILQANLGPHVICRAVPKHLLHLVQAGERPLKLPQPPRQMVVPIKPLPDPFPEFAAHPCPLPKKVNKKNTKQFFKMFCIE